MNEEGATQPARDERTQQDQSSRQSERTGVPRERDRGRRRHQSNQPRRPETQLPMEELRDLFALFTEHGLTEFEIEREGFRVHLGRNLAPQISAAPPAIQTQPHAAVPTSAPPSATSGQSATTAAETSSAQPEASTTEEESLHVIISPIVGTFYRSPSPTAEPFVRLGSHVDADSVVCIIEAMKLMNEIQAETSGEIAKIYVENGQPVEYGQPLFGVKK